MPEVRLQNRKFVVQPARHTHDRGGSARIEPLAVPRLDLLAFGFHPLDRLLDAPDHDLDPWRRGR